MYDACMDRDSASTRPRGMLVLRKGDPASLGAGEQDADKNKGSTPGPRTS